jgi:hypothetical protein
MTVRRSGAFGEEAVSERVQQGRYTREDVLSLWSGLYDRLMGLEGAVRESRGWKDLRAILHKAYELALDGQVEESVKKYGQQIKGLIAHLSLLSELFTPDTELEGEALAVLSEYEMEKKEEKPVVQERLFEEMFA